MGDKEPYKGPSRIVVAGTIIDGKILTEPIVVAAPNVTITNTEFRGARPSDIKAKPVVTPPVVDTPQRRKGKTRARKTGFVRQEHLTVQPLKKHDGLVKLKKTLDKEA